MNTPPAPFRTGYPHPERLLSLRAAALRARVQHWAPYSNFWVLAAITTTDGVTYGGSNVENANYSLTVHAEQNAVMAALADGALARCGRQFIQTVYVTCASEAAPCGGCRQALGEFAAPYCDWVGENTPTGELLSGPFAALMPLDFGPRHLGL